MPCMPSTTPGSCCSPMPPRWPSSATEPRASWWAGPATPPSTTATRMAAPSPRPSVRCCAPGRPASRSVSTRTGSSAATGRLCRWPTRRLRSPSAGIAGGGGGFVPVPCSAAPATVGGHRGAVVVSRDVPERNRAETERLRAEAIHASRARIVQAALEEPRRLGRDLHDGAQQRLINVIFALQAAARDVRDESAQRAIGAGVEETQLAIRDLRDLGAGLDPSVLAHRGLAAAIASLTARTPLPVELDLPPG